LETIKFRSASLQDLPDVGWRIVVAYHKRNWTDMAGLMPLNDALPSALTVVYVRRSTRSIPLKQVHFINNYFDDLLNNFHKNLFI
jgi:hypothetical protein